MARRKKNIGSTTVTLSLEDKRNIAAIHDGLPDNMRAQGDLLLAAQGFASIEALRLDIEASEKAIEAAVKHDPANVAVEWLSKRALADSTMVEVMRTHADIVAQVQALTVKRDQLTAAADAWLTDALAQATIDKAIDAAVIKRGVKYSPAAIGEDGSVMPVFTVGRGRKRSGGATPREPAAGGNKRTYIRISSSSPWGDAKAAYKFITGEEFTSKASAIVGIASAIAAKNVRDVVDVACIEYSLDSGAPSAHDKLKEAGLTGVYMNPDNDPATMVNVGGAATLADSPRIEHVLVDIAGTPIEDTDEIDDAVQHMAEAAAKSKR